MIPGCFLDYCRMIRHLMGIGGSWLPWRPRAVWRAEAQVILFFYFSALCSAHSLPSARPSVLLLLFCFFSRRLNVAQAKCCRWDFLSVTRSFFWSSWLFFFPVSFLSPSFPLFPWLEAHLFWSDYFFLLLLLSCVRGPLVSSNVSSFRTDCRSVPRLAVWTGQVCFSVQQAKFSSRIIFRSPRRATCLLSHHSAVCSGPLISSFSKLSKTFRPIRVTADFGSHHIKLATTSKFLAEISCSYLLVALLSCLSAHWPDWLSGR